MTNESINLTDIGIITDVCLQTKFSTKNNKNYKVVTLTLATGGEIVVFLKPEQVELLSYMALYSPDDSATKVDVTIAPRSESNNVKK